MYNFHNSEIEKQYDIISDEFDGTRNRIWDSVKTFLQNNNSIKHKKTLLDIGIGNGKNTLYAQQYNFDCTGTDISTNLIKICQGKGITNVYKKDILELNQSDYGTFDCIICIAVIHHLQTIEDQKTAIKNMINCCNKNGKILISVWSHEILNDNEKSKNDYRSFKIGPNLVVWNSRNKDFSIDRFYYIHNIDTFYQMIQDIQEEIDFTYKIKWEKQNWFCEISL